MDIPFTFSSLFICVSVRCRWKMLVGLFWKRLNLLQVKQLTSVIFCNSVLLKVIKKINVIPAREHHRLFWVLVSGVIPTLFVCGCGNSLFVNKLRLANSGDYKGVKSMKYESARTKLDLLAHLSSHFPFLPF